MDSLWIGGYQASGSAEPAGGWKWVTGEAFMYNNWADGEPNNFSGTGENENAITFQHGWTSDGKQWNDLTSSWTQNGYVVEYQTPVPVPAAVWLLGSGLLGLLGIRRKISK